MQKEHHPSPHLSPKGRGVLGYVLVLRHNQFFGLGGTGILPVPDGREARTTRKINCDGALVKIRFVIDL